MKKIKKNTPYTGKNKNQQKMKKAILFTIMVLSTTILVAQSIQITTTDRIVDQTGAVISNGSIEICNTTASPLTVDMNGPCVFGGFPPPVLDAHDCVEGPIGIPACYGEYCFDFSRADLGTTTSCLVTSCVTVDECKVYAVYRNGIRGIIKIPCIPTLEPPFSPVKLDTGGKPPWLKLTGNGNNNGSATSPIYVVGSRQSNGDLFFDYAKVPDSIPTHLHMDVLDYSTKYANLAVIDGYTIYDNFDQDEVYMDSDYALKFDAAGNLLWIDYESENLPPLNGGTQEKISNDNQSKNQTKDFEIKRLYPNPVNESVNLIVYSVIDQDVKLSVSDNIGQNTILSSRELKKGYNKLNISTIDWSNGVHVLTLLPERGTVLSQQIVKMSTQ